MEMSTPVSHKESNLRKRTLMKLVDSPVISEPVDDESETSLRRSTIETQKKAQLAQSPALNDSVKFRDQEIKDHFRICSKLFAQNKITAGIAWDLQIIDALRAVSKKKTSDSLQVASTSLDIGAKVYSVRVDDVNAKGLKLANSLARFAEKNEVEDEDNDGAAKPTKRRKKTLRYTEGVKNTIVKDRNSLLAPIPKLKPVSCSNRVDSNLSTVDNLFTNSLPMDKSCYKFLALDQEQVAWPTGPDEAVVGLEEQKSFDIDLLPKDGQICAPFQNFVLNQWSPEEEDQNTEKTDALIDNIVVYDDNGCPVAELDDSIHDGLFNDDGLADEDDHDRFAEDFTAPQIHHEEAHVVDLIKTHSELQRSEYYYNSVIAVGNGRIIDQIWAGPSHWKLKFLRRSRAMFSGSIEGQTKARPKKKTKVNNHQLIDLDKCKGIEKELEKLKRIKIEMKIHSADKITLPLVGAQCRFTTNDHDLMMKPGTVSMAVSKVENSQENHNDVDHLEVKNNDADIDHGMDHMDNDPGNDIEEDEIVMNSEQNFKGDNLVDAPEHVAREYIPYALQAKKMDMKKLKGFIWQQLTQSSQGTSKEVIPTTFSKIYADLKTVLPQAMKKELSCSLAFAAILHICNEKALKLIQLEGNKDFKIESG